MKKSRFFLSMILAMLLVFSFLPLNNFALDNENSLPFAEEEFVVPDIITETEAKSAGYMSRVKSEEKDLYSFVFKNESGENVLRAFKHPVKYVDANGQIKDISLTFKRDLFGSVSSYEHPVKMTFAKSIDSGISASYEEIKISLVPNFTGDISAKAVLSEDSKAVTYSVSDETSYVYKLTCAGFKEEIVVNQYTGQTKYSFTLKTNGLALQKRQDSCYLVDEDGIVKASIGDIIVFTADERNNALFAWEYETIEERAEYILTINLNDDYLRSEETLYPIIIDPSVDITYSIDGPGAIEDVTLNSWDDSDGYSWSLYVGSRDNYGLARALMKFPLFDPMTFNTVYDITRATVEIRDLLCESQSMTVWSHAFTGNTWTEGTANWDTVDADNYGALLSALTVSYSNGVSKPDPHWYKFDITIAAQGWLTGAYDQDKGIIFKASSYIENGNDYIWKTFSSYNRASYCPSLSVIYTTALSGRSPFYSEYTPEKFNDPLGQNANTMTYIAQYRMNCYAYAFGFLYNGMGNEANPYKQNPGDFARTSDLGSVRSLTVPLSDLMTNVVYNMNLDASRLGYTLTEYIPTAGTPIKQCGTNSRMIAVVTGEVTYYGMTIRDFHFYMQHSDGTWSHKPGATAVTNLSISGPQVVLTNSNIQSRANEGNYSNGDLKFFEITKPANWDLLHQGRNSSGIQLSVCSDGAGDHLQNAKTLTSSGDTGWLDHPKDRDVYRFAVDSSAYHYIEVYSDYSVVYKCELYDETGQSLTEQTGYMDVVFNYYLIGGTTYYLAISLQQEPVNELTEYNLYVS